MNRPVHSIYWWDTEPVEPGPPLSGSVDCDVCIVGGGYTGMWTAWFLKEAEPALDVRIVEAEWAGSGASGHNDGYAVTVLDTSLHDLVRHQGAERAGAAHRVVVRSIDEIERFCDDHGVDAELEATGFLGVGVNPGQAWRVERDYEAALRIGMGEDFELLDGERAREQIGSPIVKLGLKHRAGALLNPLKLARGLARAVRGRGVEIHERTPALDVMPGARPRVLTPAGTVTADKVVVATNAYQHRFGPFRNKVIPLWSYTLVSEPLSDEQLGRIAWPGRTGFEDKRNFITIGRMTADNRVLWAGRRAPYFYGNDMDARHIGNGRVHAQLRDSFAKFFPMWGDVRWSHAFGGCVAITATFLPLFGSLGSGVVYGYGYNGHGVAPSHTGGKILRDLLLERETEYTALPFVNGKEPRFPPEPLRFFGARLTTWLLERQDRRFDTGKGAGEMEPLLLRVLNR